MSKPKSSPRVFSREFKLGIIRRILAGENVSALGRELKLSRKDLYAWRDRFLAGGPQALRGRGRPGKAERPLRLGAARPRRRRRTLRQVLRGRPRNSRRPAPALPSWSEKSVSSRLNWIFFGKPCGRPGEHARGATGLA